VPCPVRFSTQRLGRVPQCRPPMGLVSRDQGARRKSMPVHRRRQATQRSATTPIGPKGYGAAPRLVARPRTRVAVRRRLPATATSRFQRRVVGGMARLLRCRSSAMEGHRRRRGASNSEPWRTQRTTLGAPAKPRRARSAYLKYVEHPDARKHRWVRCIGVRSRKLVRYAGLVSSCRRHINPHVSPGVDCGPAAPARRRLWWRMLCW